jgi:integrase
MFCQSVEPAQLVLELRSRSGIAVRQIEASDNYAVDRPVDVAAVRIPLMQRRAKAAGIETKIGNHTFRATGITAYLKNGETLEHAQQIANHASPRTTKLYDRRSDEISLDEVEKIRI